jgi:hypothetical protein
MNPFKNLKVPPRVVFNDADDTELWVVKGPDWQIPVYCRHCTYERQPYVYIHPAVGLNGAQSDKLMGRINAVPFLRASPGWLIRRPNLPLLGARARGITPTKQLKWPGPEKPPSFEAGPIVTEAPIQAQTEFLKYVHERTGIAELGILQMMWAATVNCMVSWLMSGKPLDFGGLFTVQALPLRKNWVQILMARVPALHKVYVSAQRAELFRMMFSHASRWLRCPEIAEMRLRGLHTIIRWNLFISNGAVWNDVTDDREKHVLETIGTRNYVRRWGNQISSIEYKLHEMGARHVAEAAAPCGRLLSGNTERSTGFARCAATSLSAQVVVDSDGRSSESIDDFGFNRERAETLEKAVAEMLALPITGPPTVDLRSPGGNGSLHAPATSGLLVHLAPRSETAKEAVLP